MMRRAQGVTQAQLADAVGVTFQQFQKYECGVNRVTASTLVQVAAYLGVPAGQLLDEPIPQASLLSSIEPEMFALANALQDVRAPKVRQALRQLVRALADVDADVETAPTEQGG